MSKPFVLTLTAAMLMACQPQTEGRTPEPLPTAFPEITTTPSFQLWVTQRTLDYRENAPGALPVGFGLEIRSYDRALEAVEDRAAELLVSSAEPPDDWFVTPLGWEGIVFVVHPENQVRQLDVAQLVAIFSGQVATWEELGGSPIAVEPVIPLEGDELREHLASTLMAGRPFTPAALLGPTPELALSMIGQHPGAIAVLPLTAVTSAGRPLSVNGVAPRASTVAGGEYPYRVEILAYAPAEPTGQVREWLVWLQSQAG